MALAHSDGLMRYGFGSLWWANEIKWWVITLVVKIFVCTCNSSCILFRNSLKLYIMEKKIKISMVNNFTNINITNNHLSPQTIEQDNDMHAYNSYKYCYGSFIVPFLKQLLSPFWHKNSVEYYFILTWLPNFFRFVIKRVSYPFGIISIAHEPAMNVTDFSIVNINCVRHFLQS
jgi:hypothetical protein